MLEMINIYMQNIETCDASIVATYMYMSIALYSIHLGFWKV